MELPPTGTVFENRYELLGVLGEGGFAKVYRARDSSMMRDVVIKVLSPDAANIDGVRSRFMREARVFGELQDPHTITMFDFGSTAEGLLYMVFEFVDGRDLAHLLQEQGPLPPEVVVHILLQVLGALQEAHSRGVLHRDIKPANILIHAYGGDAHQVKLIDFGIAKDTSPEASNLTNTGMVVGTLRYMAPEQFAAERLGPDSDMFSLGLVACEMLTGQPVIAGNSQRDMVIQHVSDDVLSVPPHLAPPGVRAVIDRMMDRDRSRRFPSAAAAAMALKQPEPAPAPAEVSTTTPEPSGPSRQRIIGLAAFVLLAVVLVGVVGASLFLASEEPSKPRVVTLPMSDPLPAERPTSPSVDRVDGGEPVVTVEAKPRAKGACGSEPPFTGLGTMSFGGTRSVAAYIPSSYDGTEPFPVVLMFHRMFRSARTMMDEVQIPRIAEEYGFIALSYDAKPTGWEFRQLNYVLDDLDIMDDSLCFDRSRVYAIGDDAGATMASTLACRTPISAYAVGFDRKSSGCKPLVPTARMRFFGARDKNVPLDGSISCSIIEGPAAQATTIERRWKERYECSGPARRWGDFKGGECLTWDCEVGTFVSCKTDGGHQWPGAQALISVDVCKVSPPEHEFPLPDVIWSFFEREGHVVTEAEIAANRAIQD